MTASHPLARAALIVSLTLLGSYATAIAYVCALTWALPPSDGAYGQPPFQDPLVFPVMAVFATACAAVISPFALALLWKTDLRRSVPVVFAVAIVVVASVGARGHLRSALAAGVIATVLTMVVCRWLFRGHPRQRNDAAAPSVSPAR